MAEEVHVAEQQIEQRAPGLGLAAQAHGRQLIEAQHGIVGQGERRPGERAGADGIADAQPVVQRGGHPRTRFAALDLDPTLQRHDLGHDRLASLGRVTVRHRPGGDRRSRDHRDPDPRSRTG